jgi:hypothetical protein
MVSIIEDPAGREISPSESQQFSSLLYIKSPVRAHRFRDGNHIQGIMNSGIEERGAGSKEQGAGSRGAGGNAGELRN